MSEIVWITGASTGIGRAAALAYAARGATVVASARSTDKLEALAQEAASLSGTIVAKPLDVVDLAASRAAVAEIEAEVGPIDRAILNAGIYIPMPGAAFDADTVKQHFDVNVLGVANGIDPLIKAFKARGRGQLAIVSSVAGFVGLPLSSAYGATKAALTNMAEALELELAPLGIDVRVVHPGFVDTPATEINEHPMPFIVSAEEAATRILKGLDRKGFEITFPKQFTYGFKALRMLPYGLLLPLTRSATKGNRR